MVDFPRFLNFDKVELFYEQGSQPVAKKCRLFAKYLQPLKGKLNDSNLIHFKGAICQNERSQFNDAFSLLNHIRDELLPICDLARQYKFEIFWSDNNAATNVLSSILQFPQLARCTNISLCNWANDHLLPVEIISKWLTEKSEDEIKYNGKSRRERLLQIGTVMNGDVLEMCDYLKEVLYYCVK